MGMDILKPRKNTQHVDFIICQYVKYKPYKKKKLKKIRDHY